MDMGATVGLVDMEATVGLVDMEAMVDMAGPMEDMEAMGGPALVVELLLQAHQAAHHQLAQEALGDRCPASVHRWLLHISLWNRLSSPWRLCKCCCAAGDVPQGLPLIPGAQQPLPQHGPPCQDRGVAVFQ